MKKILVTGSSGYVGKHLCALLSKEYHVYGVDTEYSTGNLRRFYQSDIRHLEDTHLSWNNMPFEYDCIIHLAAKVRVNESVLTPTLYYDHNINGTTNILREIKTKNFIFASTGTAENPIVPYSLSKRVCEDIVKDMCASRNIKYTIFRFYNITGTAGYPATNPDGLFYNLEQARKTGTFKLYGTDYNTPDGTAIRDYVHVMEICHAIKKAIETPANNVENLGHGKGHSVKEIVEQYQLVNNCKFDVISCQRREGDLECSVLDNVSSYMSDLYTFDELLKV